MTIYFSNPGHLDIRLLSIHGLSVKPTTTSPIGKFGTGLKYAIAGVLRLGGQLSVMVEETCYLFSSRQETIRGKEVSLVYMTNEKEEIQLPFSTDLGSHWEPWMIYREFISNMWDENGKLGAGGDTCFSLTCPEVENCNPQEYFISGTPDATIGELAIYNRPTNKIFFRGIAIFTTPLPLLYTYNILSPLTLTEDRTASEYDVKRAIANALTTITQENAHYLEAILSASSTAFEASIDWPSWEFHDFSPTFRSIMKTHATRKGENRASRWARNYDNVPFSTIPMTKEQANKIAIANHLVSQVIPALEDEVIFISEEPGTWGEHAEYDGSAIYFHPELFTKDEYQIFSSLLSMRMETQREGEKFFHNFLFTKHLGQTRANGKDVLVLRTLSLDEVLEGDQIPF